MSKYALPYDFSNIPSTIKNAPTTLARCEDEEKQCLSGYKAYNIQAHPNSSLTVFIFRAIARKRNGPSLEFLASLWLVIT